MIGHLPRLVAIGPGGPAGLRSVVAAGRAGALGVLDLETSSALDWRSASRFLERPFGVRLPVASWDEAGFAGAPETLKVVIGTASDDWSGFAERVRQTGRLPIAEVRSADSARRAEQAGVAGLILAGHEAGGFGSDFSTFILLQEVLGKTQVPAWVRGGIGPRSAAGCLAAGAAGVVVEGALLLARETGLAASFRERIGRFDGGETVAIGPQGGPSIRVFAPRGSEALVALRRAASEGGQAWNQAVRRWVGWRIDQALPIGQDSAFAGPLARTFLTVGGILQEFERTIDRDLAASRSLRPISEGSPLARSHRTRYPIVQGPMTRVSDTVRFAEAVADGGALPFLALAMLRGEEVASLLKEASQRLGGRPWGVGVLGFVPPDLRAEQVEAIRGARPPFALIAGGRPDQARELERDGIATYLHAPSPGLLAQYLKDGVRRFVFEGRECGGHVGPRSSLVLWEQAVEVLDAAIEGGVPASEVHALFAGGIHDSRSASAVSAIAASLADRGAKVGVLMGTAYLFTREAVDTGAIVARFQAEAIACRQTVLLETGPGHEVRIHASPFVDRFEEQRARLLASGKPAEAIREELERLNAGRLRIASKGLARGDGEGSPLVAVSDQQQRQDGLYMVGQAAALRSAVTTIDALHRDVCNWAVEATYDRAEVATPGPQPSDVAIVGLSAIFPGAGDARTFWENTLKGVDAIVEIPPDRWDWRLYYDADPKAPDKIVSKWGGFVPDVPFDPLRYGMPPTSLPSIEPVQLLTLEAVRAALDDAGYSDRPFPRERTSVVLGIGGGAAQVAMGYAFRSYLPMLDTVEPGGGRAMMEKCEDLLPEWTEDSFPGFLLNVAAGRVANRFDLGGSNFTVDAACGSSLAAAYLAVRELESGASDMVILGGADTVQNPLTYLAFSKTQAFSPRGRCRPFDASADGIVISEGVSAIVLKRLADAERDGDRIYAVIKGIGSSSDGRARGLTAPRPEGQIRALQRAYRKSGIDPKTLGYVECHGTGTAVGDVVEVSALSEVLREAGASAGSCAVGSVKSSIGHAKCAAGMAGLINAALALHHRVLPPTIGVETPNPKADLGNGPVHVNAEIRPWLHSDATRPRRAGVSAFGFGGTNFHAVLESYDRDPEPPMAPSRDWPAELFVWRSPDRESLARELDSLSTALRSGRKPRPRDLAHSLAERVGKVTAEGASLAIVADGLDDLREKLDAAILAIRGGKAEIADPRGTWFGASPAFPEGRIAFLFPGQGAQSPGMLTDLAIAFAEVRESFEAFDSALIARGRSAVGPIVFPPRAFSDRDRETARNALIRPDAAQPAVGAASVGVLHLLEHLGLRPDVVAGHSYGEFVALFAAGAISTEALAEVSEARGRFLLDSAGEDRGAMAAILASPARIADLLAGMPDVEAVNFNGPRQTVLAGGRDAIAGAVARAEADGLRARLLPVGCAFHTKRVAGARGPLAELLSTRIARSPDRPVYSNLDARPHPSDASEIARRMGEHACRPVRFAEMIEAMHSDGARVFVEVGPGGILPGLVGSILGDRPHLAVGCDSPGRPGIVSLLHALGRMFASGVSMDLSRIFADRSVRILDLTDLPTTEGPVLSASTWLVNGTRARPIGEPEPRRLEMGPALPLPQTNGHSTKPLFDPSPDPHRNGNGRMNGHHTNGHVAPKEVLENSPAPASDRVVLAFQETMRKFLEVQQATMLGYLAKKGDAIPASPPAKSPPSNGSMEGRQETPAPIVIPAPRAVEARAAAAPSALDRSTIASKLVAIVQERTGYPAEMLKLDLDLEADLGIDSIKRVEVLGSLRDAFPGLNLGADSTAMDELTRSRTLGAIVDRVESLVGARPAPATTVFPPSPAPRAVQAVRRLTLHVVPSPIPADRATLAPCGVVIVSDDGRGIARRIAERVEAMGHPVEIVGETELEAPTSAFSERMAEIRSRGPIAAIVHALPLRILPPEGLDRQSWSSRLGPEVRGLFRLAHAAADDLGRSAKAGGSALIAATGLGGAFASDGRASAFSPSQGAIAGLVKTLAREWPEVRARVVDLGPSESPDRLADRLLAELLADDPRAEVGYRGDSRVHLTSRNSPLDSQRSPAFDIRPGEPIVISGGARGITGLVARELARRWRPTLLLLGTSPLPGAAERPETASLTDPSALKSALLQIARRDGRSLAPSDLEASYRDLLRSREIRENLRHIREEGQVVEYVRADVRDASALSGIIESWRSRFGPIAGLIHGAGVIHDKLLRDKTLDSFDRVLGTKVEGAVNLARLIGPDSPRFAAFFSSIAGRFGNRGQSDYAAANEALNKLAIWLDRRWPGRVVSAIWGPWSGVGMVSDLEGHLGRQGLGMIPPEIGPSRLIDELLFGRKGEVEVILAGDLGDLEKPPGRRETRNLEEVPR